MTEMWHQSVQCRFAPGHWALPELNLVWSLLLLLHCTTVNC